jgi:hypothetical protein
VMSCRAAIATNEPIAVEIRTKIFTPQF